MRRWHSLLEIFLFPLKLLFVGIIFMALSSLVLNSNTSVFFSINDSTLVIVAYLLKTVGNFVVINFPFFVMLKMMTRRNGQGVGIVSGLLGYIVFLTVTMFMAPQDLASAAYDSVLGLSLNTASIKGLSGLTQYPLQTGLVGAISVGLVSRLAYQQSRGKLRYGLFSFIDRDTYALILSVFYSLILGAAFSVFWPILIEGLYGIFRFIASDISNPINLFVYGIFDRVMSTLNLGGIIRYTFWFTEMGGTWLDMTGTSYAGDVAVWVAQAARNLYPSGFGRFTTAYYVLNLFAIPGMLLALYTTFTDKIEKRRIRMLFLIALVVSLLTGVILPLEIMLAVTAPLLFGMHIFMTGVIFGVCQAMNLNLGFAFAGKTAAAMPGNLFDLLVYVRNINAYQTIMGIMILGAISFVLYFVMTKVYYYFLAIDLFNTGLTRKKIDGFSVAVGGIENIKMVNSSPFRLYVQVYDTNLIDYNQFKNLGASRILETRAGYAIDFGAGSTIYRRELTKRMKECKRRLEN